MGAHCSYFNVKLKAHICFVWNIHCFSLDLYIFTSLLCVFTTTHSFNSAVMRAFSGCTDTSPEILFSSPLKALFAEFMDSVFHSTAREEHTWRVPHIWKPRFPVKMREAMHLLLNTIYAILPPSHNCFILQVMKWSYQMLGWILTRKFTQAWLMDFSLVAFYFLHMSVNLYWKNTRFKVNWQ